MASPDRVTPTIELSGGPGVAAIGETLPAVLAAIPHQYLRERRWFGSKSRVIRGVFARDHGLVSDEPLVYLALIEVAYEGGETELYHLPLAFAPFEGGQSPSWCTPAAYLRAGEHLMAVFDAFQHRDYGLVLLELMARGKEHPMKRGTLVFETSARLADVSGIRQARVCGVEQSNTSVMFDSVWMMKNYRKVVFGPNRDLEIAQFFADYTPFRHTPLPVGSMHYRSVAGEIATLAAIQEYVENSGDGWSYVLERLSDAFARAPGSGELGAPGQELQQSLYRLGQITGEMHHALGSRDDVAMFAPESVDSQDVAAWVRDLEWQASQAFSGVESTLRGGPVAERELLERFARRRQDYESALRALAGDLIRADAHKIQIHGDYHLGQVLKTAEGFAVIDFEGEPARPLEERRAKQSPLRDVAGMLRSFDYAAFAALRQASTGEEVPEERALAWEEGAGQAYLDGYISTLGESGLLPDSERERQRLTVFFQVAKAFYELNYELNNRPAWVGIPVAGIERLIGTL